MLTFLSWCAIFSTARESRDEPVRFFVGRILSEGVFLVFYTEFSCDRDYAYEILRKVDLCMHDFFDCEMMMYREDASFNGRVMLCVLFHGVRGYEEDAREKTTDMSEIDMADVLRKFVTSNRGFFFGRVCDDVFGEDAFNVEDGLPEDSVMTGALPGVRFSWSTPVSTRKDHSSWMPSDRADRMREMLEFSSSLRPLLIFDSVS